MAPSSLNGLNIVHPVQHSALTDSQDLLSAPTFAEYSGEYDLWTNLNFQSDEPLVRHDDTKFMRHKKALRSQEEDEEDLNPREGTAAHDGHENVVTGTILPTNHNNESNTSQSPQAANFDLNHFLAGFGIDPFTAQPSLAQLLALQSQTGPLSSQPSAPNLAPANTQHQSDVSSEPPSKRARSRKTSISTADSSDSPYDTSFGDGSPDTSTPVTPAEDKRRRNTAASARFRMKKKEREAALEKKSRELEGRVNELERECEGLRRENGWLKGLVVGVTGAQPPSSGKKRARDELEAGSIAAQ